MATDNKNTLDRVMKLKRYAESLKQRLSGDLDKNLREVLEIDLSKTEKKIASLALSA